MKSVKFFVLLAFVLSMAACGSAPAPAPDDAMVKALKDAKDEAEKQKKLAQDFGGPEYFAREYQDAQTLDAEAGKLNPASAEEYTTATEKYRSLADAYRKVSEKALPRYFEGKSQAAKEGREKSAAAGAGQADLWPDGAGQLSAADADAAEGARLYGAKDYYPAKDAYETALNRYGVVETQGLCYTLKAEIQEYNLQSYGPEDFAQGEENLGKAAASYNEKALPAAKDAADKALAGYQTVAARGWEALASDEADKAKSEQDKALDIKADVELKDDYDAALASFSQGEEARGNREFKQAFQNFSQAETRFTEVYEAAARKRSAADMLIQQADKKVGESAQKAKDVQSQIRGGRR
jgi:predicted small lipoprotein YifL